MKEQIINLFVVITVFFGVKKNQIKVMREIDSVY